MSGSGLLLGTAVAVAVAALLAAAPVAVSGRVPTSSSTWGAVATTAARRRAGRGRQPRCIAGIALVGALALIAPILAALAGAGLWLGIRRRAVLARRRTEQAIRVALPDAVDLLLLCCGAGLSLPLAHAQVGQRVPGPLGTALVTSARAAEAGQSRADALAECLTSLGDRAAALAHVLVDHLRYGSPLAPGLERLGVELRLDRRRHAEETARRVPVRLLGPLVACTLPAFGVLTVVPLVAASLQALPT